jgi:hypothetical protein
MAASLRLSRGFHRLGLFLAAIPLLVGGSLSVLNASHYANNKEQLLVCAHQAFGKGNDPIPKGFFPVPETEGPPAPVPQASDKSPVGLRDFNLQLSLKDVGCSSLDEDTVSYAAARDLPALNWIATFASALMPDMAITLTVTLGVYGLVRAIGWVIGGFASS